MLIRITAALFIFFLYLNVNAQDIQVLADTDREDTPWAFKIHQNEAFYLKYHFVEDEWFHADLMRVDENNHQEVIIDFDTLNRGDEVFYPRNIHFSNENLFVLGQYFTDFNDTTKEVLLLDYNINNKAYNFKNLNSQILHYQEMESVFKDNSIWYVLSETPSGPIQLYKNNLDEDTAQLSYSTPDGRFILPNLYLTPNEEVFMLSHWGRAIKLDSLFNLQYVNSLGRDSTRRGFDVFRPSRIVDSNNVFAGLTYEKIVSQNETYRAAGIVKFNLGKDTLDYEYIFEELDTDSLGFEESWGGFANLGDTLFYLGVNLKPCFWKYRYYDGIECTNQFMIFSINEYGEVNWSKIFGGDAGYQLFDAVATEDAGCIVTLERNIYGDNIQNIDAYYVKLDRFGNVNNDLLTSVNNYEIDLQVSSILMYPNPATDLVGFKHHIKEPITVNIYDMLGCLWLETAISQNQKISIEMLPAGIYNCVFKNNSGVAFESKQLVKQ